MYKIIQYYPPVYCTNIEEATALKFRDEAFLIKPYIRFFWSKTDKVKHEYVEYTPYNKGNLYKVRVFLGRHYQVIYGTLTIAYCSTLKECLQFIAEMQDARDKMPL